METVYSSDMLPSLEAAVAAFENIEFVHKRINDLLHHLQDFNRKSMLLISSFFDN